MRIGIRAITILCAILIINVSSCVQSKELGGKTFVIPTKLPPESTFISVPKQATQTPVFENIIPTLELIPTIFAPPGTATRTPVSTVALSSNEAQARLLGLLHNNGNCQLPCLWGITPGESTLQDAQLLLFPFGNITKSTRSDSKNIMVAFDYVEDNITTIINLSFSADMNSAAISKIYFKARALDESIEDPNLINVYDSSKFGESTNYYSLPQILNDHGLPYSAIISVHQAKDFLLFNLLLVYPINGIVVIYSTSPQVINNNIVGCLTNAHVELDLYPQNSVFLANLSQVFEADPSLNYKDLEEVTSMNLNDFYTAYRQSTDKCIETPLDSWPEVKK